jgi:hypothetical protein
VFFVHVSSIFWDVSQAKRAVALAGEAIRKNGLPKAWMVNKKLQSLAMVVL